MTPPSTGRGGPRGSCRDRRGFALLTVLVWLSLLATTALGVALATATEPLATSAWLDRARLDRAAESALTLAMSTLAAQPDWSAAPAGSVPPTYVDGSPGPRTWLRTSFDLLAETTRRTCGRVVPCDDAATVAWASDRPWGERNPRWQLLVHQPLATIDGIAAATCPCYLIAWVADDPADDDGDPRRDAPSGVTGHGVLLLRGLAIGPDGAEAEVEALVEQPCRESSVHCSGIRVQSWGAVRDGVP